MCLSINPLIITHSIYYNVITQATFNQCCFSMSHPLEQGQRVSVIIFCPLVEEMVHNLSETVQWDICLICRHRAAGWTVDVYSFIQLWMDCSSLTCWSPWCLTTLKQCHRCFFKGSAPQFTCDPLTTENLFHIYQSKNYPKLDAKKNRKASLVVVVM